MLEMNRIYSYRISNRKGELVAKGFLCCPIKLIIKTVVDEFFDQEVNNDNNAMEAVIMRWDENGKDAEIVVELSFDACQLDNGRIDYEIILTDHRHINHEYRKGRRIIKNECSQD